MFGKIHVAKVEFLVILIHFTSITVTLRETNEFSLLLFFTWTNTLFFTNFNGFFILFIYLIYIYIFQRFLSNMHPRNMSVLSIQCRKHPLRGVLSKRCSENMQQIYKRTPMPKCDSNFIEITLRDVCSPINLQYVVFRTPFSKNTSGGLLLQCLSNHTIISLLCDLNFIQTTEKYKHKWAILSGL